MKAIPKSTSIMFAISVYSQLTTIHLTAKLVLKDITTTIEYVMNNFLIMSNYGQGYTINQLNYGWKNNLMKCSADINFLQTILFS